MQLSLSHTLLLQQQAKTKKKERESKNASVFYCLMIGQSLERLFLENGGAHTKVWVVAALAAAPFRCC